LSKGYDEATKASRRIEDRPGKEEGELDIPPVDHGPGDLAGVLALQEEGLVLRVGKLEGLSGSVSLDVLGLLTIRLSTRAVHYICMPRFLPFCPFKL
jgi:hypothetical protein